VSSPLCELQKYLLQKLLEWSEALPLKRMGTAEVSKSEQNQQVGEKTTCMSGENS
jgi:hypothetical protein